MRGLRQAEVALFALVVGLAGGQVFVLGNGREGAEARLTRGLCLLLVVVLAAAARGRGRGGRRRGRRSSGGSGSHH